MRLLICVFNFRMNRRLMEPGMPSFYVEMDHSAAAREGCTVSTLAINSQPKDWQYALQVRTHGLPSPGWRCTVARALAVAIVRFNCRSPVGSALLLWLLQREGADVCCR